MIQDFRQLGFFNSKKANLFQNKFFLSACFPVQSLLFSNVKGIIHIRLLFFRYSDFFVL